MYIDEPDLAHLSVARLARADLLVTGIHRLTAHVTGLDRLDALQVVEYGLQAPETASGKSGDFLPCVGHVIFPFFALSVLFCRVEADHHSMPNSVCGQARRSPYRPSEESNMSLLRSLLAAALVAHALASSSQPPS